MAQKVITKLVDDIDGTELDDASGETVSFALNGQTYEIDLGTDNSDALLKALATYVGAGRRIGRATAKVGKRSKVGPSVAEVRDWARANGHDVPNRGRISQSVRDAFDKG